MSGNEQPTSKQIFWGTTVATLLSTWPLIFGLPIPYFAILSMVGLEIFIKFFDISGGAPIGLVVLSDYLILIVIVPLTLSVFTAYLFSRFLFFKHTPKSTQNIRMDRLLRAWRYFWLLALYILIHWVISYSIMLILDNLGLVRLIPIEG